MAISDNIEAVIFDMGGTLRDREFDEKYARYSCDQVLALLGCQDISFIDELQKRFRAYSLWAQDSLRELSEMELWTRWLVPDYPSEKIASLAPQLNFWWRERTGRTALKQGVHKMLDGLHQRGYRIALISNTTSPTDSPNTLEQGGLTQYFETMILSTVCGIRKPSPEIFWLATRAMNIEPARCAYVGDRISRDVVGSRQAGFSISIIIEPLGKPRLDEQNQTAKPDYVIHELSELLDIFPALNHSR